MADFHNNPFDEATLVKLELFKKYIREWIPVFVHMKPAPRRIRIVDFFAGPGRDADGALGSPLIALEEIRHYEDDIRKVGAKVHLELNEAVASKASALKGAMEKEQVAKDLCSWRVRSRDFHQAFEELLPKLRYGPNLLLMDQQGVKFISDEVFQKILRLPLTDFIFFIASSALRRFESHPNIQKHIPISKGAVTSRDYNDTHRAVAEHYRELTESSDQEVFLGHFSIKKGPNIYGLIFGSTNHLGMEKFLRVCWKLDPVRGEANFDIDDERIEASRPHLFSEMDVPKKVEKFREHIENGILSGDLATDGSVYIATLKARMLPMHGREILSDLIKRKLVRCSSRARVSKAGYREPRRLEVING